MAAIMPKMSSESSLVKESAVLASPSDRVRWTRTVALAAVVALIALGLAWELWLAPTGRGTLAVKVIPLFFPLVGLWRYRLYTYRWLSLLVWVYCGEGLVRSTSETGLSQILAMIEVALCVVLFAACAAQVRWRLTQGAALESSPPPAP
jgi:uncharacterized membrane protein